MATMRVSLPRPACRPAQCVSRRRSAPSSRRLVVQANLGKYLGEAAASIFSPTSNDSVPWGDSPFTGDIVHHEDLPRLRQLHEAVVSTRQKVAGCTDPDATNFNPVANLEDGTCTYVFQPEGAEPYKGTVGGFISQTLSNVWGKNFSSSTDTQTFENTTYTWGGDKVSQRDIQRLLSYERVLKKTLDQVEKEAESKYSSMAVRCHTFKTPGWVAAAGLKSVFAKTD